MDRVRIAAVVNGCSGDYEKQVRQLYSFTRRNGLEAGLAVVLSEDPSAERGLLDLVWTKEVIVVRVGGYFAETAAAILQGLLEGYGLILFPGNIFGTEVSSRLACRMRAGHLNGVRSLRMRDGGASCSRMVYSNLASADYEIAAFPFLCSVASSPEAELPAKDAEPSCTVLDRTGLPTPEGILSCRRSPSAETSTLEDARLVFVFGRGVQSKEILQEGVAVSEALGADYGVTRPVAMSGWAPFSRIVGVSGSQIHPDLCLVLGASCASAFYAGIEHSGTVININTDESANLLDRSDLLIVGDCAGTIRAVGEELAERKKR